jgi:hypothetical protein
VKSSVETRIKQRLALKERWQNPKTRAGHQRGLDAMHAALRKKSEIRAG